MLKIAYCDDIKDERDKIMSALSFIEEKWKEEFDITSFPSGEDLCDALETQDFQVILLDILMNGMDGIDTATKIRAMGKESLIIFISSYDKRIKELFAFQTIAFIDKPIDKSQLESALLKACEIIQKDKERIFTYKKQGKLQCIPIQDIIYFESQRNNIILYSTKFEEIYYDTLSSTWSKLQNADCFIMPSKSYIFNLKYVSVKSDVVIIKGRPQTYSIGAKYKTDTEQRYMKYIEKRYL